MNLHPGLHNPSPLPHELEFLTVTNGHCVSTPRHEVSSETIEALRPIVMGGGGHIRGWDIQMVAFEAEGGFGFELHRDGVFVSCCYVAWTQEGSLEGWAAAQCSANVGLGARTLTPPALPWLSVVIMPEFLAAISFLQEAADLERCIAWTGIEMFAETETPTSSVAEAAHEGPDCHSDQQKPGTVQGTRGKSAVLTSLELSTQTPRLPMDGSVLSIGPDGLTMIVQYTDPTESEVAALRRGRLDLGVLSVGGTGFLLTRFSAAADTPRFPAMRPIALECPFHIGLLPPSQRYLPRREQGMSLALEIVIQDERGHQRGARLVGLTLATADAIERVVNRQAQEAARSSWTRSVHEAEVARFQGQRPDLRRSVDRLLAKAWASQTVH